MAVALVGRGTEQAELTSTWQAARGGQARVVGLTGPAGIGKTALVKVIYDEKTRAVLAAEAEVSAHPPDEATQRAIRAGSGLVVFR